MPRQPRQPATRLIRSFATAKRLKWSAANVYNAVGALNRLHHWLEPRGETLETATTDDLNEYLGWRLDQGLTPNTVISDRTHIRAFYRWATERTYLRLNPARGIESIKGSDPDPARTHVTEEWEYRALLATCKRLTRDKGRRACDNRDAAIITLMWETGLRRSEITRIDLAHIDWDRATIHLVRTKGRTVTRSRDIELGDEAMEAITFYVIKDRGEHDGPLFESITYDPGTHRRKALAPNSIGLILQRRAAEADATQKLPGKVRPVAHGFRRASAINDIDDDISARAIQYQKGWTPDGRMLARYTKLVEKRQSHDEYRAKRGRRHLRAVDTGSQICG